MTYFHRLYLAYVYFVLLHLTSKQVIKVKYKQVKIVQCSKTNCTYIYDIIYDNKYYLCMQSAS